MHSILLLLNSKDDIMAGSDCMIFCCILYFSNSFNQFAMEKFSLSSWTKIFRPPQVQISTPGHSLVKQTIASHLAVILEENITLDDHDIVAMCHFSNNFMFSQLGQCPLELMGPGGGQDASNICNKCLIINLAVYHIH